MAFLHQNSCECLLSPLELFSVPPTQISIDQTRYAEYRPIATLSANQVVDFVVPGAVDEYVNLTNTILYLKIKVKKNATTDLTEAESEHVTPNRLLLQALFSQLDVTLNGKLASNSTDQNSYRSYLQTLLNYNSDAKNSQLTSALWLSPSDRKAVIKESAEVELIGRLHSDISMQDKLILNNVEIKFRFVPNKPAFSLIVSAAGLTAGLSPIIEFVDMALFIEKVKPAANILLAHARALAEGTAKYVFRKTDIKVHTINSGSKSAQFDNIFQGQVPSRVVLGLVSHNAYNGDFSKDSFYFNHYGLSSLAITVDGQMVNGRPLNMDFAKNNYAQAYISMFGGLGTLFHNTGNAISYKEWKAGHTIYCFDLTPDQSADDDSHVSLVRNGVVRVDLRFAADLTENVNLLVYSEQEAILEIDERRNVLTDA